MRPIGFSTGALALGDFRTALSMLQGADTRAIELSALRDKELIPLVTSLDDLDLSDFRYVSVHAPSKFQTLKESAVADALLPLIDRNIPVVIHPDAIGDRSCWDPFGPLLCIENMDKRKPTGRTVAELEEFFSRYPHASFCLDIAHARQVDSTMTETRQLLRRFGKRLRQVHISELDAGGHHERLSLATILATQSVSELIDENTPIIVESMIKPSDIRREITAVQKALTKSSHAKWESQDWGELA